MDSSQEVYRLLNKGFKIYKNCVPTNRLESDEHHLLKFLTCAKLSKMGLEYLCEATLKNNKRPDIIVPKWNVAIEIVVSETEESLAKKRDSYLGLQIYIVRCVKDIEVVLGG